MTTPEPTRVQIPATKRKDLALMMTVLSFVFGLLVFIFLAAAIKHEGTQAFDNRILRSVRELASHPDGGGRVWAEESAIGITSLGSVAVMVGLTLTVIGFLLLAGKPHASVFLAVAVLGALALNYFLKESFARARPEVVPRLQRVTSPSFPSGHALISTAVYTALGAIAANLLREQRLRLYALSVALTVPFLVGLSRIYLGVHYLTDVVAGWTIGLLWGTLCWLTFRFLQRRGTLEPPR